jgi:FkbM family methyltransferase
MATVLRDCRHGKMLFLKGDRYIGQSLASYGEFSELEAEVFLKLIRADDVVLEAGANIGAHTVHLARLVGPKGAVIAFEPQRIIFQLLCANIALNDLLNVHAFQIALGREIGKIKVPQLDYTAEVNFGGLSLGQGGAGEDAPLWTVDSMALPSLRMLKVDVEGMEIEVLEGARATIAKLRPLLYVENDREDRSEALITLIGALGYNMWWHLPRLYNPRNFDGNVTNIFGNIVSINLLCLPKEATTNVAGLRPVSGPKQSWRELPPS